MMKKYSWVIVLWAIQINLVTAVDSLLNFSSYYNLKTRINHATTHRIGTRNFAFIYFNDSTIVQFNNNLQMLSSFSLGSVALQTFNVNNNAFLNYCGVVKGGDQIVIIEPKAGIRLSFKQFKNVKQFQMLYYQKPFGVPSYDAFVWTDETFHRHRGSDLSGPLVQMSPNDYKNYSSGLTRKNIVLKVIRIQETHHAYFVVFTSLKQVYLVHYTYYGFIDLSSINLVSHKKIIDLSPISNLAIINQIIDKRSIVIIQFGNYDLYAFNMFNGNQILIDNSIQTQAKGSVLKTASPSILSDGERVWVFGDKSVRVDLTNNRYRLIGVSHSGYSITNWSGMISLGSSYNFVFRANSSRIFSYCETLVNGAVLSNCVNSIGTTLVNANNLQDDYIDGQSGYSTNQNFQDTGINDETSQNNKQQELNIENETNWNTTQNDTTEEIQQKQQQNLNKKNETNWNTTSPNDTAEEIRQDDQMKQDNENNSSNNNDKNNSNNNSSYNNNNNSKTNNNSNNSIFPNNVTPQNDKVGFSALFKDLNDLFTVTSNITSGGFIQKFKQINITSGSFTQFLKNSASELIKVLQNYGLSSLLARQQNIPTAIGELSKTPGARPLLVFLSPLFGFLDDYSYYIYHKHQFNNLNVFHSFLRLINNMTSGSLDQVISYGNLLDLKDLHNSDYTNYTHPTILAVNSQQTFFIITIQQMLFQQYIFSIIILIVVKIIILIIVFTLALFSKKNNRVSDACLQSGKSNRSKKKQPIDFQAKLSKSFITTKEYLQDLITLKSVLVMFIGSNMIFISFNVASQLRIMYLFQPFDILNICFTVAYGFLIVLCVSFIFIYKDLTRNNRSKMRIQSQIQKNERDKRLCLYDTYFINSKNLLNGFVHGFFIDYPYVQYPLLIAIKINLVYILMEKKKLLRKEIRLIGCAYFLFGIVLDCFCMISLEANSLDELTEIKIGDFNLIEFIQYCLLSLIIGALGLQMTLQIFFDIANMSCFKKNDSILQKLQRSQNQTYFMLRRQNRTKSAVPVQGVNNQSFNRVVFQIKSLQNMEEQSRQQFNIKNDKKNGSIKFSIGPNRMDDLHPVKTYNMLSTKLKTHFRIQRKQFNTVMKMTFQVKSSEPNSQLFKGIQNIDLFTPPQLNQSDSVGDERCLDETQRIE